MAIVYTYPIGTPEAGDLLVGTKTPVEGEAFEPRTTLNFTVSSLLSLGINGTVGTIPVFTGANTIGNSLIKQVTFDDSKTAVNVGTIPTKGSGSTSYYPVWIDNFQVQGTMTSSGNVSIGTPREIINQQFDLNLLNSNSKIAFGDNHKTGSPSASYTEPTWNVIVGEYGSTDTDQLQLHGKEGTFFTKGNLGSDVAMVINNNGKVGIGTTAPSSELDVSGNITASKLISSANNSMFVEPSATSYFNHLRVDSILGSTLSPGVYGWQFSYNTPHTSGVTFRFDNDHYRIYSGAKGEIVRFTGTGNVGIGTTAPSSKLDVDGDVRVRGPLDLSQQNDNTFAGQNAGNWYNVTASSNTAFGKRAQEVNVTGSSNSAFGALALANSIDGSNNTAIGANSMALSIGGSYNTGVGSNSLSKATAGKGNTAIGYGSLAYTKTSSYNTAVGHGSLNSIKTGSRNTAVGNAAGKYVSNGSAANLTGRDSIFIGNSAKANADNETNQIVIGADAVGNGDNTATIGTNATTALHVGGNGASVVLKSPDGTKYKIAIANGGTIVVTAV